MIDRRSKREELKAALSSRDPYLVASVLLIPPIADSKGSEPKQPNNPDNLQDNGTDWSFVLNSWLDACEAAQAVSTVESIESKRDCDLYGFTQSPAIVLFL